MLYAGHPYLSGDGPGPSAGDRVSIFKTSSTGISKGLVPIISQGIEIKTELRKMCDVSNRKIKLNQK